MSFTPTKGKFHTAIDGVGLLLQGSTERPAYAASSAPVYGTRFASGDRDYNDLSQWWYFLQTDWSGGIKDRVSWEDDARFYYSTNIDAYTVPGSIRLNNKLTQQYDGSATGDSIIHVQDITYNNTTTQVFIDEGEVRTLGGSAFGAFSGDPICMLGHKNKAWGTTSTDIFYYDGTTTTSVEAFINTQIAGSVLTANRVALAVVGTTLYIIGLSDTPNLFCVKTSVAAPAAAGDFTVVFEIPMSSDAEFSGVSVLGSKICMLFENEAGLSTQSFWVFDTTGSTPVRVRDFSASQSGVFNKGLRYVRTFNDVALVTIEHSDGNGWVYEYDGTTLTEIWSPNSDRAALGNQADVRFESGCVVSGKYAYWGNLVYDGESFFNGIKPFDDNTSYVAMPVGYSAEQDRVYYADTRVVTSSIQEKLYYYDNTGYKTGASESAFIVFSQHDKLQSIDKLLNSITIGFSGLASGQSIEVYYTTSETPPTAIGSWTSVGTASNAVDGSSVTYKTFRLPDGINSKKFWFRLNLKSTTSGTPIVTDFTAEYLPLPDYKKQWELTINCADELKRLDGQLVETTGRELKSRIEKMWWTKSALDFQDLDYATTTVADNPLTNSATTITVASPAGTYDFPEQGRLRIEDEEILYTGKTPTTFTGCTRGARGTRAVSHAQNTVVNNAYKVLVMGIEERTPVILEDKELEHTVSLSLREV